jgi:hypothetical protein
VLSGNAPVLKCGFETSDRFGVVHQTGEGVDARQMLEFPLCFDQLLVLAE